jgi:AraC family transcriptional regulator of adaptative response/methylated-DNA-[protein]-cysteine methyltransferase
VQARDPQADGRFFYAVLTTGVYCRPSCASRAPRPENVSFHTSAAAAESAGFRACLRCCPDRVGKPDPHVDLVASLCRFIEASDATPSLDVLARRAGLSRFHLHRVFKSVTGLTPLAYAKARRTRRLRSELERSTTVTDAIYAAGYASQGHVHEDSRQVLGMSPSRYRAGGADTVIRFAIGASSLGAILVAASDIGICAITIGDDPGVLARDLQDRFPKAELRGADASFEQVVANVVGLVEAPRIGLGLPLDIRGTAFQQRVWQALREIPPGSTASYAEVALRIGAPTAARAVAQACAANALAVAIPCHRVVRTDGSLSGYRWGVARKRELLAREASAVMGQGSS